MTPGYTCDPARDEHQVAADYLFDYRRSLLSVIEHIADDIAKRALHAGPG